MRREQTPDEHGCDTPGGLRGRVLLTGATGFLGQALLERLLADHPQTRIDVLVRPDSTGSAQSRLRGLLHRDAFAPWRSRDGDLAVERALADRVTVLPGSLADAPRVLADRPPYDLVLHSAGDVTFRAGLDEAFATNVTGAAALYEAVCAGGAAPHIVHVSTAYVWTDRVALGEERAVEHEVDWRAESRYAERVRAAVHQVEDARRLTDRVLGARAGAAAGSPERVATRLADAGYERAREHGWTDVYTFTKALGERAAEQTCAGAPLTILRPTIIEGALARPYPGWLDGFKVTDPLIVAYAKDRLPAFPGWPHSVLDIVPVDVVVNAALASARRPPRAGDVRYLQVGTSVSNPLCLDDFRRYVEGYFAARPWVDRTGHTVRPTPFRFVSPDGMRRRLNRAEAWTERARRVAAVLPGRSGVALGLRLGRSARRLAMTQEFVRLYQPYSCSETRYDDAALRALDRTRPLAERRQEPLDVTTWRWADYLGTAHLPAVRQLMREHADRAAARALATQSAGHTEDEVPARALPRTLTAAPTETPEAAAARAS